jgi:hypothetical protein
MIFQRQRPILLVMGCLGAGLFFPVKLGAEGPQSPGNREQLPRLTIQSEMSRLVRQDAEKANSPDLFKPVTPNEGDADDMVSLEPMVVVTQKSPDFTPPRETSAERFFRTGTMIQHVGRKVTTRFWMKGDRGIMLSLGF